MKRRHPPVDKPGRKYQVKMSVIELLAGIALLIANIYLGREYLRCHQAPWVKVHVEDRRVVYGRGKSIYYYLKINYQGLILEPSVSQKTYLTTPIRADVNVKLLPATNEVWFNERETMNLWWFAIIGLLVFLLYYLGMPLIRR